MTKNEFSNWKEMLYDGLDDVEQKNFDKLNTTFLQLQKMLEFYGIDGLNSLIKEITDYSLISKIEKGKVALLIRTLWSLSSFGIIFMLLLLFSKISYDAIIAIFFVFIIVVWMLISSLHKSIKLWIKEYENLPKVYKSKIEES